MQSILQLSKDVLLDTDLLAFTFSGSGELVLCTNDRSTL